VPPKDVFSLHLWSLWICTKTLSLSCWVAFLSNFLIVAAAERGTLPVKAPNGAILPSLGTSCFVGEPKEHQKIPNHSLCRVWVWHDSLSVRVQAGPILFISLPNVLAGSLSFMASCL
jgi:hypothetical protein